MNAAERARKMRTKECYWILQDGFMVTLKRGAAVKYQDERQMLRIKGELKSREMKAAEENNTF